MLMPCAICRRRVETVHVDEPLGAVRLCVECLRTQPVAFLDVLLGSGAVLAVLLTIGWLAR